MTQETIPEDVFRELMANRPDRRRTTLSELEGPNGLNLLLYLDENSPVMKTDVYAKVSKSGTMKNRLERMEDLGLITIRYAGYVNASFIFITPKGKAVVRRIRDILNEL